MRHTRAVSCVVLGLGAIACAGDAPLPAARSGRPPCDAAQDLAVSAGFCSARIGQVRGLGVVRNVAIASNGDLLVATLAWDDRPGGIVVLRDTSGDGLVDVQRTIVDGSVHAISLANDTLYFSTESAVRKAAYDVATANAGVPQTVVGGLPTDGEHRTKSFARDPAGNLYVSVGSASNACQVVNRTPRSVGRDPCPELESRAGVWRFTATGTDTTVRPGIRFATGLRNAVAMAWDSTGNRLIALQHGMDDFQQFAPDVYSLQDAAERPVEELLVIREGADYGWPYCYFDHATDRRVTSPWYESIRSAEQCDSAERPALTFPAHWGPNSVLVHTGTGHAQFRNALVIAFHGPTVRLPTTPDGLRVVVVPAIGAEYGAPITLVNGFAKTPAPQGPRFRPMGLAEADDGSIIIADNVEGVIWRIMARDAGRNPGTEGATDSAMPHRPSAPPPAAQPTPR